MAQVVDFVRASTGLVFPEARARDVEATINRAMKRLGATGESGAVEMLRRDENARELMIAELTIGETYFHRDPAQFEVLRTRILPDLLANRADGQPLRIWSAGCASGEEAYTVAMIATELGIADRVRIIATDISHSRLQHGRVGIYGAWALRGTSPADRQRWFTQRGKTFEVIPALRRMVQFGYLNLAAREFPSPASGIWSMDVILCRNVLIYFDDDTVRAVAQKLIRTLNADGVLIPGASDPQVAEYVACRAVLTDAGLIYQRPGFGDDADARTPTPLEASFAGSASDVMADTADEYIEVVPETVAAPLNQATDDSISSAYVRRDFDAVVALASARERTGAVLDAGDRATWVRALANQGQHAEAQAVLVSALAEGPTAELQYLRALLALETEDAAAAMEATRQALYLDRTLVVGHLTLAEAERLSGNIDSARRSLRNAARLLDAMTRDDIVPASDGESAGRMLDLVRTKEQLLAMKDVS